MEQARLAPGKAWETEVVAYPFQGMQGVTLASPQVLGYLTMEVKDTSLLLPNDLFPGPSPAAGAVSLKLQLLDYDTGKEYFAKDFPGLALGNQAVRSEGEVANAPLTRNLAARARRRSRMARPSPMSSTAPRRP